MTWRYIAARRKPLGYETWTVEEYYTPTTLRSGVQTSGWTDSGMKPRGDSQDGLREVLQHMLGDVERGDWIDLETGIYHETREEG